MMNWKKDLPGDAVALVAGLLVAQIASLFL